MAESERMSRRGERLGEIEPVIRRIASARLTDPYEVDEVVQETMTRLLEASDRLENSTLASYAAVTARNLITSMQKSRSVARKHAPGLIDASSPADPQDLAVAHEEHRALIAALDALRGGERDALLSRDLHDLPTADIAEHHSATPGATATRIARARAKVRVEFLLVHGRVKLPTPQCRPILLAIALGEKRRQDELGAGDHIGGCGACRDLVARLVGTRGGGR